MRRVTVLIVNYKAAAYVLPTLNRLSLVRQDSELSIDAVIVDNASPDDSAAVLRSAITDLNASSWIHLIEAEKNSGFAGGNNEGLRYVYGLDTQPDAVFFLNPDTLLSTDCIDRLIHLLADHPSSGVVGARIENEDGSERASAFAFPSLFGELTTTAPLLSRFGLESSYHRPSKGNSHYKVDWVSGAAFMVRRRALEDVPYMDDRFFLYFEEVDFQRKLTKAGWEIRHHPGARCLHYAGVSTGIKGGRAVSKPLPDYWYESWRHYFVSNHGRAYAAGAAMARLVGTSGKNILGRLRSKPENGAVAVKPFARDCLLGAITQPAPQRNNP